MKYIEWNEYTSLCDKLTREVFNENWDGIVGINNGGVIFAGILAERLGAPLYPVFLLHTEFEDEHSKVKAEDLGKIKTIKTGKILIADDFIFRGKCLEFVKEQMSKEVQLKTMVLINHKIAELKPDYVGMVIDDIPIFPYEI